MDARIESEPVRMKRVTVERTSDRRSLALKLFFGQLVLNLAWSPIFFAGHDITLAKVVIIAIAVMSAATAVLFYRLRPAAGLLMIPYIAWLLFATALNARIETLNPGAGVSILG